MRKITLLLLICLIYTSYGQQTISFESGESYNLGDINGQNSWFTSSSGGIFIMNQVVSADNATDGTRALKIVNEPAFPRFDGPDEFPTTNSIGVFYPYAVPVDATSAVFSFDFNIDRLNADTSRYLINLDNNANSKIVTQIFFNFNGNISVLTNTAADGTGLLEYTDTNVDWSANSWVNVRVEINGSGLEVFINDTSVLNGFVATPNLDIDRLSIAHDNFDSIAYFDNFKTNDEALSNDDFIVNNLEYRYLGSSKELLLDSSIFELDELRVYNMLGQEILKSQLSGNNERINLQNLQSGVYIAQVKLEGRLSSFKFTKY